jgi:superfamily II DNA or RNA helicase
LANKEDSIIVASYGVFSAGVNLPAIENIIFAHPFKSKITGLQSIGRGLRLKEGKTKCVLFDIADNMAYKKTINSTYRHFGDRLKMYTTAGFTFSITHLEFNHE